MARALNAPKDPEFLVGTIAAMRLLSGQRQPQDPLEREMLAHLQALQLKPEVAKRIVAAFEAKPRRDRRRLLGSYADKSHALESLVSAAPPHSVVRDHRSDTSSGGRAGSGSGSRTWPGSGNVGPLAEEVSTGAEPGIRYSVRYKGLWCQEETTGLGSDEIYVVTSGLAINKGVNTAVAALTHPISTQSKYYGDVDSREERVGPVAVVYTGNPDTLSLAVVVMEHDYGDPDYYRDEVNTFVAVAIAAASKLWPPAALLSFFSDNIVDAINWILGTGDDVISSEVKTWERPALEAMAIQTPGPLSYNPNTGLFVHFVTTHHGDGSKYVVGFDIERDPPRPAPPLIIL
ncbi:MAG: hypothetical protein KGM46_02690 [Pseudomonadota bacterium]|nr:hypothetical protein [Pseudomonadota bacterium]